MILTGPVFFRTMKYTLAYIINRNNFSPTAAIVYKGCFSGLLSVPMRNRSRAIEVIIENMIVDSSRVVISICIWNNNTTMDITANTVNE
ncbi:MAG: hypothetical protein JW965_01760 [Bacteroidales bacterium]|nr:hypothetical protein [Bacteroidales bacterium]